ncbi:MAG: sulfite exporter TauE/SafE family protein [Pseudomonadota bacterium]
MDIAGLVAFGLIVFAGSYVQAVTGFAMAMIIVAVVGGMRLLSIPELAATTSLLTILNVILALWGRWHQIYRPIFTWLALGQVPAIFLGFWLMTWLDVNLQWVLELSLGLFITIGGLSMWLKPHPWAQVAGPAASFTTGVAGGIVGGMFSASGPILGWFSYNQPLELSAIRATLLGCFMLTTTTRTGIVMVEDQLTTNVLLYAAIGIPVVVLGTWLGRQFPPPVSEAGVKRGANLILLFMGGWILIRSLWF